jgi:aminoglycoside 3-N-acetyltransferase
MQTRNTLAADFARLGMTNGQPVVVHSSLSSIGYVLGGAQTVVRALLDAIGSEGTLVMPAFSPEVSDPANWPDNHFRDDELKAAQEEVPTFDPAVTPTSMGAIAEGFRTWPGVVRSAHPQVSVAARGPLADRIISPHELAWAQGNGSPFHRLYDLNAKLLLLGVGFNRATMLHYAESLVPHGRRKTRRIPSRPKWKAHLGIGAGRGRRSEHAFPTRRRAIPPCRPSVDGTRRVCTLHIGIVPGCRRLCEGISVRGVAEMTARGNRFARLGTYAVGWQLP